MPVDTTPEKQAVAKAVLKELIDSPRWPSLAQPNTQIAQLIQALGTTVYNMLGFHAGSMNQEPDAGEPLITLLNEVSPGSYPHNG